MSLDIGRLIVLVFDFFPIDAGHRCWVTALGKECGWTLWRWSAIWPRSIPRLPTVSSSIVASRRAHGLRAWLDGIDVDVGRALEAKTGYGAKTFADAANVSLAAGQRVIERGETLRALPALEAAMRAGDVSAAHVDAATRALRQVPRSARGELAAIIDRRVGDARSLPANEFEQRLRVEVRRLQGDDDEGAPEAVDPVAIVGRAHLGDVPRRLRVRSAERGQDRQADPRRGRSAVRRACPRRVSRRSDREAEVPRRARGDLVAARQRRWSRESPSSSSWSMRLRSMRTASPPSIGDCPVDLPDDVLAESRGAGEGARGRGVAAGRPRPRAQTATRECGAAAGVASAVSDVCDPRM